MPANECIPFFEPGSRITGHCTAAVTGKRFVNISATIPGGPSGVENIRIAHAAANGNAIGVSAYDGLQDEELPLLNGPGMIVPVTADGAINAGDRIVVGATGKAKAFNGTIITSGADYVPPVVVGIAMCDAADGADAMVRLRV